MSAVVIIEKWANGDESHSFGGIMCDVEGCDAYEPQKPEPKNLHALGWFIAPGRHRCPKHFHDDVPPRGVIEREVDKATKRI